MSMDRALLLAATRSPDLQLLHDCMTLEFEARRRPSARERLEEALGPDLARRLLASLTANGR